jgi:hypothetical protein
LVVVVVVVDVVVIANAVVGMQITVKKICHV